MIKSSIITPWANPSRAITFEISYDGAAQEFLNAYHKKKEYSMVPENEHDSHHILPVNGLSPRIISRDAAQRPLLEWTQRRLNQGLLKSLTIARDGDYPRHR